MVNNEGLNQDMYLDYPVDISKFKKGPTADPDDDNELWKLFVDRDGSNDLAAFIDTVDPKLCKQYVSPTTRACWKEDCDAADANVATPAAYERANCEF